MDFTMQKGKFLVVYLLHYNRLRDFYRLIIAASIDHGVPRKLFVHLINLKSCLWTTFHNIF